MSGSAQMEAQEAKEARLDRLADDLAGVIQSLRLMSDMQRQQGEQLGQILALLTPELVQEPRADLAELLAQLVGVISRMATEVRGVGTGLERMTQSLPEQMAAAIEEALVRADRRGIRR